MNTPDKKSDVIRALFQDHAMPTAPGGTSAITIHGNVTIHIECHLTNPAAVLDEVKAMIAASSKNAS